MSMYIHVRRRKIRFSNNYFLIINVITNNTYLFSYDVFLLLKLFKCHTSLFLITKIFLIDRDYILNKY